MSLNDVMNIRADQEKINEVMDWFDFGRVHKTMAALDWKWFGHGDEVPDEPYIRKKARELMKKALVEERNRCARHIPFIYATAGFIITIDGDCLTLAFSVEEWTTGLGETEEISKGAW